MVLFLTSFYTCGNEARDTAMACGGINQGWEEQRCRRKTQSWHSEEMKTLVKEKEAGNWAQSKDKEVSLKHEHFLALESNI